MLSQSYYFNSYEDYNLYVGNWYNSPQLIFFSWLADWVTETLSIHYTLKEWCSTWHIFLTVSQPDFVPCDTFSWLWASQTLFHVTHYPDWANQILFHVTHYPDSEPARLYSMWHIILTLSQPDFIHTPLNAVYLAEKRQIPILYSLGIEPTIYHTRVKHANHYTTKEVYLYFTASS